MFFNDTFHLYSHFYLLTCLLNNYFPQISLTYKISFSHFISSQQNVTAIFYCIKKTLFFCIFIQILQWYSVKKVETLNFFTHKISHFSTKFHCNNCIKSILFLQFYIFFAMHLIEKIDMKLWSAGNCGRGLGGWVWITIWLWLDTSLTMMKCWYEWMIMIEIMLQMTFNVTNFLL